jgi:hypothetical protein
MVGCGGLSTSQVRPLWSGWVGHGHQAAVRLLEPLGSGCYLRRSPGLIGPKCPASFPRAATRIPRACSCRTGRQAVPAPASKRPLSLAIALRTPSRSRQRTAHSQKQASALSSRPPVAPDLDDTRDRLVPMVDGRLEPARRLLGRIGAWINLRAAESASAAVPEDMQAEADSRPRNP